MIQLYTTRDSWGFDIACAENITTSGEDRQPVTILNQNDYLYYFNGNYYYPDGTFSGAYAHILSYIKDTGYSFFYGSDKSYLSNGTGGIILPFIFVGENNKGFHYIPAWAWYYSELIYDSASSSYQVQDNKMFSSGALDFILR